MDSLRHRPGGHAMQRTAFISFVFGAVVSATAALADETVVVRDVMGPEGPLYVDGNLYYVGWISNALSKWDGKTSTVLNSAPGCGHNGLALTKRRTFIGACTNDPGTVLEFDRTGKEL